MAKKKITVYLDEDTHQILELVAARNDRSVSRQAARLIEQHLPSPNPYLKVGEKWAKDTLAGHDVDTDQILEDTRWWDD
jgi:hypothetical protein